MLKILYMQNAGVPIVCYTTKILLMGGCKNHCDGYQRKLQRCFGQWKSLFEEGGDCWGYWVRIGDKELEENKKDIGIVERSFHQNDGCRMFATSKIGLSKEVLCGKGQSDRHEKK